MELTAEEIASATGGRVVAGDGTARASSFAIDSRLLEPGACFVALQGERDGHAFVGDAFRRGATVALVAAPPPTEDLPTGTAAAAVQVPDPLEGLGALAARARERLADADVVGITGSAGKTATKDLTAAALRRSRRVHASPASFNNEAGVPLTLLGAPPDTEVVVAEMGARFAGNLRDLAAIAHPTVGVVTHIGFAHAEHLGGRDGITQVKGELLEALPADGLAVLNADCDRSPALAARTKARVLRVGRGPTADVRSTAIELDDQLRARFVLETPWGSAPVALEVRGDHQVDNAAMAAAVAVELGAPLDVAATGLADARAAAHRMELTVRSDGVLLINDAYNSSPTSAAAALRSLAALPDARHRVAILGEMRELGADAEREHAALGEQAGELGLDLVVVVGPAAAPIGDAARRGGVEVLEVPDALAAARAVEPRLVPGDAVLVKASRAVGLERVVVALLDGEPAGRVAT